MSTQAIRSRENPNLELIAFHGHFATRHSHNSHYLDITRLKHEYSLAHDTALALANHYIYEKSIDTIICMDGSEVIGAFLARQLTQKILFSVNNNKSICVVTPEYDTNGQLLFRENLVSMIHGTRMSSPRQKIYNFFCSFSGSFIAAHSCFKWVFTVILPFRIP